MIKLVCEAKEPVYAELGAEPSGYQVSFGPDRDGDNTDWAPRGANPSASASLVLSPEAAESLNVGDAFYLGATLGQALDDPDDNRASWASEPGLQGQSEPVHPDTAKAEQEAQNAVPGGEPVPFTDDGRIDGGTITESGSGDTPVAPEPDTAGKRRKA